MFGYTVIHHHLKSETLVNVLKDSNSFYFTREVLRELLNLLMVNLTYPYLECIPFVRQKE